MCELCVYLFKYQKTRYPVSDDIGEEIVRYLQSQNHPVITGDIAKAVGKRLPKEINSTLYSLQRKGWVYFLWIYNL